MKQIIVVRTDLEMPIGKIAAQVAHASIAATLANLKSYEVEEWLTGSFTKVVVKIDSEDALNTLIEKAEALGVIVAPIIDSGRTVFNGVSTLTCAAFGPDTHSRLSEITGDLKLL